jgi:hypothetical protein
VSSSPPGIIVVSCHDVFEGVFVEFANLFNRLRGFGAEISMASMTL